MTARPVRSPSDFPIPAMDRTTALWLPSTGLVRGGVVALHGASTPKPLFDHLAVTLNSVGWAVLSYDRRTAQRGGDVPLKDQADDALLAVGALRERIGNSPVGIFGFSQGAWAAAVAAARAPDEVALLALVGCSGVSPAVQMRYFTSEMLRRNGFDNTDRRELRAARLAYEDFHRGRCSAASANAVLNEAAQQLWFSSVYLPTKVSPGTSPWDDMDFDPEPIYRQIRCPTLLVYGDDEECVPAAESIRVWRATAASAGRESPHVVMLPNCGHFPAAQGDPEDITRISPTYTRALIGWFAGRPARVPVSAHIILDDSTRS